MANLFYIAITVFVITTVLLTANVIQHAVDTQVMMRSEVEYGAVRAKNLELDLEHTRIRADNATTRYHEQHNIASELFRANQNLQRSNNELLLQYSELLDKVEELEKRQQSSGASSGIMATIVIDDEDDPLYVYSSNLATDTPPTLQPAI
jgi:hypothetical protein